jgi:hypothetical protein
MNVESTCLGSRHPVHRGAEIAGFPKQVARARDLPRSGRITAIQANLSMRCAYSLQKSIIRARSRLGHRGFLAVAHPEGIGLSVASDDSLTHGTGDEDMCCRQSAMIAGEDFQ